MIEILNQFLFKHKFLSLKGIGTVEIEANEPFYNELSSEILPPALSVHLSADVKDEQEASLLLYIGDKLQLHEAAAKALYVKFCRYIDGILKKGQSFDWAGIFHLNYNTYGQFEIFPNNQLANLQPAVKVRAAKPVQIVDTEKPAVAEVTVAVAEPPVMPTVVATPVAVAREFLEEENNKAEAESLAALEEEVRGSGIKKWLAAIVLFIAAITLIVLKYMKVL